MTKRKTQSRVPDQIRELLSRRSAVSAGVVAEAAGITRQAAHYHLSHMVEAGELFLRGAGRGAHYVVATAFARTYPTAGLQEDAVWREVVAATPELEALPVNVRSILAYAFTEMMNNAIDHSRGENADVRFWISREAIAFEILDDGIGAFRSVRERMELPNDLAALQEIEKGKATTAPDRHTGEGIFFTSRAVDVFLLESGELRWTVDNLRDDIAVGDAEARRGTRVRSEISPDSERILSKIFDQYTVEVDVPAFQRTSVRVRLFEVGERFVSRSEAKRLASRLEGFEEVELDFDGIQEVGQGFVDELFRVWARDHPRTTLLPINASAAVRWTISRAVQDSG
jgi:anti-sigma regulatory factor (Ser/Thr protein kinase)